MIETRFSYSLGLSRFSAPVIMALGLLTTTYSQNSLYSDPLLISIDSNLVSTMAASTLDKESHLHIAYVGWYAEPGAPNGVASEIFYTNNIGGEFKIPEKLPEAKLPFSPSFEDDFYYSNSVLDGPLPVELSSFTAKYANGNVKLDWRTETEVTNYGFDIERKGKDANDWKKIGFVEGHGNTNSPKNYFASRVWANE